MLSLEGPHGGGDAWCGALARAHGPANMAMPESPRSIGLRSHIRQQHDMPLRQIISAVPEAAQIMLQRIALRWGYQCKLTISMP